MRRRGNVANVLHATPSRDANATTSPGSSRTATTTPCERTWRSVSARRNSEAPCWSRRRPTSLLARLAGASVSPQTCHDAAMTSFSKVNGRSVVAHRASPGAGPGKATPSDVSAAAMDAATQHPVANKTNTAADAVAMAFMGGFPLVGGPPRAESRTNGAERLQATIAKQAMAAFLSKQFPAFTVFAFELTVGVGQIADLQVLGVPDDKAIDPFGDVSQQTDFG